MEGADVPLWPRIGPPAMGAGIGAAGHPEPTRRSVAEGQWFASGG